MPYIYYGKLEFSNFNFYCCKLPIKYFNKNLLLNNFETAENHFCSKI